jgi:histidine ammonia-lyase
MSSSHQPRDPVVLDGHSLSTQALEAIAGGRAVQVEAAAYERVAAGRAIVERYFNERIPAYGLTTGLGMRAGRMLTVEEAAEFSYRTVRGRAQALGDPIDERTVRAVMAVRLNTMLTGASGGSQAVVDALADALNRGFMPAIRPIGSIGAADLVVMAALPHALIGEGEAVVDGHIVSAAEGLRRAQMEPLRLQPKDGLVLCNNTAFSTALAALAANRAETLLASMQVAAALSMEAFGGNLSPLLPASLRVRPQPGQVSMGDQLRSLLEDGPLGVAGSARRLQDPVSFRCIAQTHGATRAALDELNAELLVDLNASPDNPVVLIETAQCVSTGNFHLPRLTQTLDAVSRSFAWAANDTVARVHRFMHSPFTDLPPLLAVDSTDSAGFGPLLKPTEALRAQIIHLATPVPVIGSHNADGVEDAATFAPLAAENLGKLLELVGLLVAIELIAASQALDLRRGASGPDHLFAPSSKTQQVRSLERAYRAVRSVSAFIGSDRPVGREIEAIASLVADGTFAKLAG